MKFEYTADSNHKFNVSEARKSFYVHNFVKLNQVLNPIIPFLREIRDAIEIADFFQLNYSQLDRTKKQIVDSQKSSKDLAYDRFENLQFKQKNPIVNLDELPFGKFLMQYLCNTQSIKSIVNVFMPNVTSYRAYKTIFRPTQNANSHRKTNWQWHQDAKFHSTLNDITIWIPLSRCGLEAPGLEFLKVANSREIMAIDEGENWYIKTELQKSLEEKYERYSPEFNIGDCVVFNSYAIHRTFVTSGMDQDRTSFDFRVTSNG